MRADRIAEGDGEEGVTADLGMAWSVERAPFLHGWPAAIREALRVVALWWWVLPIERIPRWAGALLTALLAGENGVGGGTLGAEAGWDVEKRRRGGGKE